MAKAKGERVEKTGNHHSNQRTGHHSSGPSNRGGSSTNGSGKGKSFKDIGPRFSDARKGTYVGHLDKLKQRLIYKVWVPLLMPASDALACTVLTLSRDHQAKVKKAYHRTLSREAKENSDRLPPSGSLEPDDLMQGKLSDAEEAEEVDDDNSMDVDTPRTPHFTSQHSSPQPDDASRKRKASEELEDVVTQEEAAAPQASTSSHAAPYVHPSRRQGQLRPKKPKQKETPVVLRQPKKPKRTPEEIEQLRERRERERQSWARKTKKGQPNLNARMDVLLSKYAGFFSASEGRRANICSWSISFRIERSVGR